MTKQIKSRQRVSDHGEVYTHEREVNAMLDLVADQTNYSQSTFLEPACGTGNFLVEILRRKLNTLSQQYAKSELDYQCLALVSLGSLYGIDLLPDNIAECQSRLLAMIQAHHQSAFRKTLSPEYLISAKWILSHNMVAGDALSLRQNNGDAIVFSEWKPINRYLIQRRDYDYSQLIHKASEHELPLFSDLGDSAYIPKPIKIYPAKHFLEIAHVA